MGNSNAKDHPKWIIITKNGKILNTFDINAVSAPNLIELIDNKKFAKSSRKIIDYRKVNQFKSPAYDADTWEYYRDNTLHDTKNPEIADMKDNQYYVGAQYYGNTSKIIPKALRISLLKDLDKLSKDDSIKYDVRNGSNGHYYYSKIASFGMPNIGVYFRDMEWGDKTAVGLSLPTNLKLFKLQYNNKFQCMTTIPTKDNSAIIHDFIDPNKNLNEHKLWIPTIFDCEYKISKNEINNMNTFNPRNIIKSSILNLDYVKHKSLYIDIALVFKLLMQPMFENIIGYKLSNNEKIIVKSMKYILQKPGDVYIGNIHREGMGEGIIALGLYYPQVSSQTDGMSGGELKLQVPEVSTGNNSFLRCHTFKIHEGSCIVFSNQLYHQLPKIEFTKNSKNTKPISRTILTYFLVNKHNTEEVIASDNNSLQVNINYNWIYILQNWKRKYRPIWITEFDAIIFKFLFPQNYDDYVYYRRYIMREEKTKPLFKPISRMDYLGCEETYGAFEYDGPIDIDIDIPSVPRNSFDANQIIRPINEAKISDVNSESI